MLATGSTKIDVIVVKNTASGAVNVANAVKALESSSLTFAVNATTPTTTDISLTSAPSTDVKYTWADGSGSNTVNVATNQKSGTTTNNTANGALTLTITDKDGGNSTNVTYYVVSDGVKIVEVCTLAKLKSQTVAKIKAANNAYEAYVALGTTVDTGDKKWKAWSDTITTTAGGADDIAMKYVKEYKDALNAKLTVKNTDAALQTWVDYTGQTLTGVTDLTATTGVTKATTYHAAKAGVDALDQGATPKIPLATYTTTLTSTSKVLDLKGTSASAANSLYKKIADDVVGVAGTPEVTFSSVTKAGTAVADGDNLEDATNYVVTYSLKVTSGTYVKTWNNLTTTVTTGS